MTNEHNDTIIQHTPWSAFNECRRHYLLYLLAVAFTVVETVIYTASTPKRYAAFTELSNEHKETDLLLGMSNISAWLKTMPGADDEEGMRNPEVYNNVIHSDSFVNIVGSTYLDKYHVTYKDYLYKNRRPGLFSDDNGANPTTAADKRLYQTALIKDHIVSEASGRMGTIKIRVDDYDPTVAAIIADTVTLRLQEYLAHHRLQGIELKVAKAKSLMLSARKAYYKAQAEYAKYADAHDSTTLVKEQSTIEDKMKKRDNAFADYQKNTIEYYRQSAFLHRSSPAFAVVYYSTTPRDPYTPSPIVNFFAVLTITVILVTWFILIRKTRSRAATGPQSLSVNDAEQQMPESEMSKKI